MSLPPTFTAFVERFGEAIASVVLTLVYFLVLGPFALFGRLFGDPLGLRRKPSDSAWQPWTGDGAGPLAPADSSKADSSKPDGPNRAGAESSTDVVNVGDALRRARRQR